MCRPRRLQIKNTERDGETEKNRDDGLFWHIKQFLNEAEGRGKK